MTTVPPPKRSNARGRARREEILRIAKEVFATQGYRGGSLATIAQRVGHSEPGLLRHFPTKEHLLLDILALREREDTERRRRLVDSGDEPVLEVLAEMARQNAEAEGLVRLFAVLSAESIAPAHPGHDWFVERFALSRAAVAEELAREREQGRIAADADVDLIATQIFAMWDGLHLQWLLDPERVDFVHAFGDYLAQLRRRLRPAP